MVSCSQPICLRTWVKISEGVLVVDILEYHNKRKMTTNGKMKVELEQDFGQKLETKSTNQRGTLIINQQREVYG